MRTGRPPAVITQLVLFSRRKGGNLFGSSSTRESRVRHTYYGIAQPPHHLPGDELDVLVVMFHGPAKAGRTPEFPLTRYGPCHSAFSPKHVQEKSCGLSDRTHQRLPRAGDGRLLDVDVGRPRGQ